MENALKTKEKMKEQSTRVQFDMPPQAMERLKSLKERTEAGSYTEVFKNALKFYEFIIDSSEKNQTVFVQDSDNEETKKYIVY